MSPRQACARAPRFALALAGIGTLLGVALAFGGCATPQPSLADADTVLAPPSRTALIELAAHLNRPRLAPVALDFTRPLTAEELAVIAVLADPDLKAARAKAGVAEAQVFSAGLLPDPQLNAAYDYRLSGPDPLNGVGAAVIYDLMALRSRSTVVAQAKAARDQARLDLAWQEWSVAGQAKLLAERIAGLQAISDIDERTRAATRTALDTALRLQAKGDIRADEVETRRLAAADSAVTTRQAERDLDGARLDLNKLLGFPPETRLALAAPSPPPPPPSDAEALFATARAQRLDLQALRAGYRSQNAAVRKAMMDAFPSFQLTVTRAQDTADNQTIGPAVNFVLPLWNRNRGGIAIAKATQSELRAEYAARLFATRADIAALVDELQLEARQRAEVAAQVRPLEPLVAATETAARRGDIAEASAAAARLSLSDKQLALAVLEQAMAEQQVSLALAVGAPLAG